MFPKLTKQEIINIITNQESIFAFIIPIKSDEEAELLPSIGTLIDVGVPAEIIKKDVYPRKQYRVDNHTKLHLYYRIKILAKTELRF